MSAAEMLDRIAREVSVCTKCALHESRKKAVTGEGPADAEVMFIGEGPGFHENEQGRPFVGASGKFLDQLLEQAGLLRGEVFIANVVKCRPPGNRDPQPDELEMCNQYLEAQIGVIDPSVIITLGRISMGRYFAGAKITSIHGQMQNIGGRFIIPMYHPAAALHQPALRPSMLADFAKLPDQLNEARAALGRTPVERKNIAAVRDDKPQQLSLF
jgi:DNA polymerase